MRRGTAACLMVLAAGIAGLVLSVRHAAAPGARDGVREYTFACWGASEEMAELHARVLDPINARHRDVRLRAIPIPSDYDTKLGTMIAGDVAPDLFYLSQEYLPAFAAQGALLDLTDRIDADTSPVTDLSDYYPSVLSQCRYRGRLYGLPWIAQPVVLYCNAALFREAGVGLPDATWDWARFTDAASRLTGDRDADGRVDQWGFILNGWPPPIMWVWQNGGRLVDATGRLNLDDPRVTEALNVYAGLIHRHRVAPPLSVVTEAGFAELFRAGKVAMFMGGAADDLDRIPGLDVVVAEVPAGPAGIRATFAWTAGLHISRSVRDPERAFELYKELLDGIQHWKVPAPRRSLAAKLEAFEPRKAAAAEVIRRAMETMRTPTIFRRHAEWQTTLREELEEPMLRDGTPAEQILRRKPWLLETPQ